MTTEPAAPDPVRSLPWLGAAIALSLYAAGVAMLWWLRGTEGALSAEVEPLARLARGSVGVGMVLLGGLITALLGMAGAALTGAVRSVWAGLTLALAAPLLPLLPLYFLGLIGGGLVGGGGEPEWRSAMLGAWGCVALPAAIGALVATLQARERAGG